MKRMTSLKYTVAFKFLTVILILSALLLIFIPLGLRNFFLEESYRTIEKIQSGNYEVAKDINTREVNHLLLASHNGDYTIVSNVSNYKMINNFISVAILEAGKQTNESKRYVFQNDDVTIYYVINKTQNHVLISFVYATYVDYFIDTLYHQLIIVIIIVVILSLFISFYFSSSITRPLILMSKKIKSISKNKWDDEILITRNDEIGELQMTLEEMRNHLKNQDRIQREMFQNISHDLKTPIMIIEGYSQMILDGFVESSQLNEVASSIIEEAKRLEKKVKMLLYINKIEQLSLETPAIDEVEIDELIHVVISPFRSNFSNINFHVQLDSEKPLLGNFEQWRVAIENIIENMTRFAKSEIRITYNENELSIFNDGETIDEALIQVLFEPFSVGNKSNFGLGLTITKKIVNLYGYQITVENCKDGVKFIIKS